MMPNQYRHLTALLLPLEHIDDWDKWAHSGGLDREGAPISSSFEARFEDAAVEAISIAEDLDCGDEYWQDAVELQTEITAWADAVGRALEAFEDEEWILDEVDSGWCAAPGYHWERPHCNC